MIEVTNITRGPIQLVVKSLRPKRAALDELSTKFRNIKGITVINVPGIGAGKNTILIEDERHTDYIDRAEKQGFITQKRIKSSKIKE